MDLSTVLYRKADTRDLSPLYELMVQYIVVFYKQPEPDETELKQLITHLLNNPASGVQFVAEKDGKLIGFATLYFTFSTLQVKRAAILNDLFVLESSRGEKAGQELFTTCLTHIREQKFAYMTWETAKDNQIAQRLYNKMGGKESDWMVYEIEGEV